MSDIREAIAFKTDLWGDKAKSTPEGPTFENMAGCLPPLQYVNAPFRHYPIVLSLKDGIEKIRFVSNGSRVEAGITGQKTVNGVWHAAETWMEIRVEGNDPFGSDESRLIPPRYLDGYLPIVQVGYRAGRGTYREECFAAQVENTDHLAAFVKLTCDHPGSVDLTFGEAKDFRVDGSVLRDRDGKIMATFNRRLNPLTPQGILRFRVSPGRPLLVFFPNRPLEADHSIKLSSKNFNKAGKEINAYWRNILRQGSVLEVPEKRVMDAWRALVIGNFMLSYGDQLCYSAQNLYQTQFVAESGDAVMALALLGHPESARFYVDRLLRFPRAEQGIAGHNAAFRLLLAMRYWLLTRDLSLVRKHFDLLDAEAQFLLSSRDTEHGLIQEGYAGDTRYDRVFPLHTNGMGWRAVRDWGLLCRELGQEEMAQKYAAAAKDFEVKVREAIEKSMRRNPDPPFVPGALLSDEKAYDTLTESIRASYYNLVAWYFLTSELYGPFDEPVTALIRYAQRHGGFLLGLIRFDQHSDLYTGGGFDDLYGLPYMLLLLQRKEVDDFLVSFYGKLAHGMTRETFINAEVTGWYPVEGETGRRLYLPPNSSSNAAFLIPLRDMLVMETDMNRDGFPDELRLLSGTPRAWLEDGKRIVLKDAPTAFGPVSLQARSLLSKGEIRVECELPRREHPERIEMTLRLPKGMRLQAVRVNGKPHPRYDASKETVDLSGLTGRILIRVRVAEGQQV